MPAAQCDLNLSDSDKGWASAMTPLGRRIQFYDITIYSITLNFRTRFFVTFLGLHFRHQRAKIRHTDWNFFRGSNFKLNGIHKQFLSDTFPEIHGGIFVSFLKKF